VVRTTTSRTDDGGLSRFAWSSGQEVAGSHGPTSSEVLPPDTNRSPTKAGSWVRGGGRKRPGRSGGSASQAHLPNQRRGVHGPSCLRRNDQDRHLVCGVDRIQDDATYEGVLGETSLCPAGEGEQRGVSLGGGVLPRGLRERRWSRGRVMRHSVRYCIGAPRLHGRGRSQRLEANVDDTV
jgi:hypothetical protein